MSVLRPLLCVVLCLFSRAALSKDKTIENKAVVLLDQTGKEQVSKERDLSLSFVGILTFEKGGTPSYCNAIHLINGKLLTSETCFKDHDPKVQVGLTFFDKSGTKKTTNIPVANLKVTETHSTEISLPENTDAQWDVAGNSPYKDEIWFGGFKPKWELVRVWGFTAVGERRFQMQVNTCKGARQTPVIQRFKQNPEEGSEDLLEELKLFPDKSPYSPLLVIEDCVRPVDDSVSGALITLAKSFEAKLGILDFARFSPYGERIISALTIPEDHIFLRYLGADGKEHPLPPDLASQRVLFTLPF